MRENLERCAESAAHLVRLLEERPEDRREAAKAILVALARLYAEAVSLPWPSGITGQRPLWEEYPLSPDDRLKVSSNVAAVFGDHRFYWLQYDPIHPRDGSDGPVLGDLADDLMDIWADIKPALTAWEEGREDRLGDIGWAWRAAPFEHHWGDHAAAAIRAMHAIAFDHDVGLPHDKGPGERDD